MRKAGNGGETGSMMIYLAVALLLAVGGSLYYLSILETSTETEPAAAGPVATLRIVETDPGVPAPPPPAADARPLEPLPADQLRRIREVFAPETLPQGG
jgi:hypothetical protein